MNKQELVDAVGERLGDRKAAATAVEAVLDSVSGALADGERVSLFGFGVFERVERAARTARNPATGAAVQVPATSVPRFRAGQALKDAVNGRSSRTARATSPGRTTRTAAAASDVTSTAEGAQAGKSGAKGKGEAKGKGSKAKDVKAKDGKAKDGKAKKKAKST